MDIVSAASAVLGIVGFGLQVYQTLFAFVTKAADAEQCVQSLMIDINLTVSALREVHDLLTKEESLQKTRKGRRLFSDDGLADTRRTAEQCMAIFKSIVAFILRHSKKGKNKISTKEQDPNYLRIYRAEVISKLESIKWALVQDEVNLYMARLGTFKLSLLLILSVTSLKAQHQNLNDFEIVTDQNVQADILYIDDLEKAKKEARDKWTLLRAAILQKSQQPSAPEPRPDHNHVQRPDQTAAIDQEPPPNHHSLSNHVTEQAGDLSTQTALGAFEEALHHEISIQGPNVDGDRSRSQQSSTNGHNLYGTHQNPGAHPEPRTPDIPLSCSGLNLDPGLGNEPVLDPSSNTAPMPLEEPTDERDKPLLIAESSKKSSRSRTHLSKSSEHDDRTHPALKDKWTSFDAYLYKDEMIRKLKYTKVHIDELLLHILRQSPDRWWKTFSSLSNEEHAGVEEALNERRLDEMRSLLGIQVISARYAHFLRLLLRLVSLGMLDHRDVETRALIIIIGNKAAEDLENADGSEVSPTSHRLEPQPPGRAPEVIRRERIDVDDIVECIDEGSPAKPKAARSQRRPQFRTPSPPALYLGSGEAQMPDSAPAFESGQAQHNPAQPSFVTTELRRPSDMLYLVRKRSRIAHPAPPQITETYSGDDDDDSGDEKIGFRHHKQRQSREQVRLSRPSDEVREQKKRAPRVSSRDDMASISNDSLYGSLPSEYDDAEAARNRVQELLSRWTAPASNEDEVDERVAGGDASRPSDIPLPED